MPSPGHILEMAHSVANDAVRAVAMQRYRVLADLHEDAAFFGAKGFRQEVDLNFMLVALRRLRRAAALAAQVDGCQQPLQQPMQRFDTTLPGLITMRNVGEHIDEYITGSSKRRHRDVAAASVGVRFWTPSESGGYTFAWVGQEIDIDVALKAAEELYLAILATMRSWRPAPPAEPNEQQL